MNSRPQSDPRRTILGEGRFARLVDEGGWEFAERSRGSGVVASVAITNDNRLVLTEQYRPAVRKHVIDLPAGLAGDSEDYAGEELQTAAARELEEETGYTARSWKLLTTVPTSPGLTAELVTLFLAEDLACTGAGGGDASESIAVHAVPLAGLSDWLDQKSRSCFIDPKVYAGLWLTGCR